MDLTFFVLFFCLSALFTWKKKSINNKSLWLDVAVSFFLPALHLQIGFSVSSRGELVVGERRWQLELVAREG